MNLSEQHSGQPENHELHDLGTHAAGATDLHETRETAQPVKVNPPVVENPGPYDTRDGRFEAGHPNA